MRETFSNGSERFEVVAIPGSNGRASVRIDGREYLVTGLGIDGPHISFEFEGQRYEYMASVEQALVRLMRGDSYYSFGRIEEGTEDSGGLDEAAFSSRMPGTVLRNLVKPGTRVAAGTPLVILEAMKMEHTIEAPAAGVVNGYPHAEGSRVMPGDLLVEFSFAEAD